MIHLMVCAKGPIVDPVIINGVYLLLVNGTDPPVVKIGFSRNIGRRVKELGRIFHLGGSLIATSTEEELELHSRFKHLHTNNEFFLLKDDLLVYINSLRKKIGMDDIDISLCQHLKSELYIVSPVIPTENRRKRILELPLWYQDELKKLLNTRKFRSMKRKILRDKLVKWLDSDDKRGPFTSFELKFLIGTDRYNEKIHGYYEF